MTSSRWRSSRCRALWRVFAVPIVFVVGGEALRGQDTGTAKPPTQSLAVTARSLKIVPPATEQTGTFAVTNTGREPVPLSLEVGDLLEGDTPLPGNVRVNTEYPPALSPGQTVSVGVLVEQMTTSGTATAAVINNGARIGDLVVIRYPVAVTIDEIKPGTIIAARAGSPIRLTLRNADRASYDMKVGMTVGAQKYCASTSDATKRPFLACIRQALSWMPLLGLETPACEDVAIRVPGQGVSIFSLDPPCASSSGAFAGLIKDEERDGTLSVFFSERDPVTHIPFRANVGYAYLGAVGQQLWSTVFIALVLGFGGVCSLVSRHWVPNELARRHLLEELDRIDVATGTVSGLLGSELDVLMRVEAKRLIDQVRQVFPISADSGALLAQYRARLVSLQRRLKQLAALDELWDRLQETRKAYAPPSEVHAVEDRLRRIAQMLRKTELTDLELEKVQGELATALTDIEMLRSADEATREALKVRLDARREELRRDPALGASEASARLRLVLPGAFGVLEAAALSGDAWSDAQVQALLIIRDYIRMHDASTDPLVRQRLIVREPALVHYLSAASVESLRSAARLVREMREGIYDSDLAAALKRSEVRIDCEPRTFQTYQLFRLTLRFDRDELNGTAAQSRFRCEWEFPTENALRGTAQRVEEGWSVCRYLTQAATATVRASVYHVSPSASDKEQRDTAGDDAVKADPGPVATFEETLTPTADGGQRRSHRMKAELIGLGVVLLIALLGLVTGAREQITKLDIVPGLIAVFLLGFSADSIKGMLTAQTGTTDAK